LGEVELKKEKKRSASVRRIQATIDEIQAMTRNPEYREDYLLWKLGKMHDLEIMFKYGIAFVVDPESTFLKVTLLEPFEKLDSEWQGYIQDEFDCFFIREWASQSAYIVPHDENWITQDGDGKTALNFKKKLRNDRFLTLEIDLSQKKERIMHEVEELVESYSGYVDKGRNRDTPDRAINRFLVWDEYKRLRSFKKIADKYICKPSTVTKAYNSAWQKIMDEKYDPKKHNKKRFTMAQLEKTCDICPERKKCNRLCPEVASFAQQDRYVKFDAFHKTVFTEEIENITEEQEGKQSPDDFIEQSNLLVQVNQILGKDYASLDDALKSLSKKELNILHKHPTIRTYH